MFVFVFVFACLDSMIESKCGMWHIDKNAINASRDNEIMNGMFTEWNYAWQDEFGVGITLILK